MDNYPDNSPTVGHVLLPEQWLSIMNPDPELDGGVAIMYIRVTKQAESRESLQFQSARAWQTGHLPDATT